ncbi:MULTISPECIES: substrate-binding domain-containing protein [Cyanophyceae]|uniref:substrate-binding domain-containing protein n=2 Tax=Cyanophyceae TaxID=3028117 RepID=UPI0020CB0CBF|nr:substrate-binding domain-containing protein [Picosynechococcus sp. PCC 7002]
MHATRATMAQKNDTLPLMMALVVTLGILGGGGWWFLNRSGFQGLAPNGAETGNNDGAIAPGSQATDNPFSPPATVAPGTVVKISGSTSMVQINTALKNRFELQYPQTRVETTANGSSKGLEDLLAGNIDLAAISRPLQPEEMQQGLKAIAVTTDAVAIVVAKENPFSTGLTGEQVQGIFQGNLTDWSAITDKATGTIRVINRPPVSGTYQTFQETVLNGSNFGNGPNFMNMEQDATTPILQALGADGISYATYSQIANQQTVRTVPIDGVTPESDLYPYTRTLYYAYQEPASPQVEAFLGFVGTPVGAELIQAAQQ